MKRGYLVSERGREWGFPVVAHTAREAKRMVWDDWRWNFEGGWADVTVRWVRDARVVGLPFGMVDDAGIALSHGLIDYIYH